MNSIYKIAEDSIKIGGFVLADKLHQLTAIMMIGQIDPIEYDELVRLAQEYANPENDPNKTNILGALRTINAEITKINERLNALEATNSEEPVEEEIEDWKPWSGIPGSGYTFGTKVRHLGIVYISEFVGENIWEPGVLGTESLWKAIG